MLRSADMPVLLMVLVHLTGDTKWINAPYLPARDLAFFPDESGGFSEQIQSEICDAACNALIKLGETSSGSSFSPDDALYSKMMSVCVGEHIPDEYREMMLEEMRFKPRFPSWDKAPHKNVLNNTNILIIGAGMSGLCAAIKFKEANIPFEIVEKNSDLGGTWHENRYPGVGCDVPNHFYSYSFEPNPNWSEYFSTGQEINEYFHNCADKHKITEKIQFDTTVEAAEFDSSTSEWRVQIKNSDGSIHNRLFNIVIFATGQLNHPKYPNITGRKVFKGTHFHTARWPQSVSLKGKKVAIIGTGASAMQLAKSVADEADTLDIFQRSAQWAIPTRDYHRTVSPEKKWLLNNVPLYANWYRFSLVWRFSDRLLATVRRDPDWPHPERSLNARNDKHREALTKYINDEIGEEPEILQKVTPDYPPYAKRILVDNEWFKTLKRKNVNLITDDIREIKESSICTKNNKEYEIDIIIYATGFNASHTLANIDVKTKDGFSLNDHWGEDNPRAYLGITVPKFANLFFLYGPNTNLGHGGSIIFITECQVRYILASVIHMIENRIGCIECKQTVHDEYNKNLDNEHSELIWAHPGVNSWYKNKLGRIVSIMPWRLVDYWNFTSTPNFDDFNMLEKDTTN